MQAKSSPVKVVSSGRIKKDIKRLSKRYNSIEKDIEPLIRQLEAGEIIGDKISGNKYSVFKSKLVTRQAKVLGEARVKAIFQPTQPPSPAIVRPVQ